MKKINTWIGTHIESIIICFLLLGPIFDCITAFSIHFLKSSFTAIMVVKVFFLGILFYDLFFISKCRYRRKIVLEVSCILLYIVFFCTQIILQKDVSVFLYECQNLIRTFFFPIALLCIYNLYLEDRFRPKTKYLYMVLFFYLLFIFLPMITHTGFNSYAHSKVGTIGWFYSCNEVGGILSILFPFLFHKLLQQKKWVVIFGMCFIFFIYFTIGTKVPILSLFITCILYGIYYFVKLVQSKKWKPIACLFVTGIIGVFLLIVFIPKTSFYKNIQIHLDFLEIRSISDLMTIQKIDHFIFSERIRFLGKTANHYHKASWNQKLLGIGYIENYGTDDVYIKQIEMDYYDVFFRHGIVGSIVYFIPFIWLLVEYVKKMKIHFELSSTISVLLILLLSLFSGHIVTAPSVSIIVVYVLILSIGGIVYES